MPITETSEEVVVRRVLPPEYVVLARFIYYITDAIELALALRFIARALGANPGNPFIQFLYRLTDVFLAPFRSIFPALSQSGLVIEWSTLVAMLVYLLVAMLLVRLCRIIFIH